MKGPPPETYEEAYVALAPVAFNIGQMMEDLNDHPDAKHLWQALSYQAKALAARVDHMLYTEHVKETIAKHGKHSDTACPPNSRAMCSYKRRA